MLKIFSQSLRIGLSHAGVTVLTESGRPRPQCSVVADAQLPDSVMPDSERLTEVLSSVLKQAQCTNRVARIVLADELVRFFMVTPPKNPEKHEDFQAAAAMRFQALYDETAANWKIDADWDAKHSFLACAVPRGLLSTVQKVSETYRLRVVEISPQFISAANRWRKNLFADAWLGVVHNDNLTVGAIHQKRFCAVRSVTIRPETWRDEQWLPDCLRKEALRLNLPIPSQIHLCGNLPGHWSTQRAGALTCMRLGELPAAGTALSAGIALANTGAPL